jgi:hypothetical protein
VPTRLNEVIATPPYVEGFELATNDVFEALRATSVREMQAIRMPTPRHQRLWDALIVMRRFMGE